MKKITIGVLAHVDSGKTTLSEALLFCSGNLNSLGRVDKGNSYFDTNPMERNRGITIFSKQTSFQWREVCFNLLDTPGHVDFAAEMERTLPVLDYGVLIISANDGIQAHTVTLWKLLEKYGIPTFIFINKMDLSYRKENELMEILREKFGNGVVNFSDKESFADNLSLASETLTEAMLERESVRPDEICDAICKREIFPCFFGKALKNEGVKEFLDGLSEYTVFPDYSGDFSASTYKIIRDEKGERLTFVKVTGGEIRVKDSLDGEKINQIRLYSGDKFTPVEKVTAGDICALTGLLKSYVGKGFGTAEDFSGEVMEPYLLYNVILPEEVNVHEVLKDFMEISEEDPKLKVTWNDELSVIEIQMMGKVQTEILKSLVKSRFGYDVEFGEGQIIYRETLATGSKPVEGVGHFESLKHFAEVHLMIEPLERGAGNIFVSNCREDDLDKSRQNLILSHLEEKPHKGVLTGSMLTDVKITLIGGKAHKKHTKGGDFREAAFRALRQGLMQVKNVLLEPWCEFTMELPMENLGRAMADIQNMGGRFTSPETKEAQSVLKGRVPVAKIKDYAPLLNSYTGGLGRLSCFPSGYEECQNTEEIIENSGYNPDLDLENPSSSIFCSKGSIQTVAWDMIWDRISPMLTGDEFDESVIEADLNNKNHSRLPSDEASLKVIFERTYGPIEKKKNRHLRNIKPPKKTGFEETNLRVKINRPDANSDKFLLIDGYNLIYASEELSELADSDFGAARDRLIDILCNYRGFSDEKIILVFDAYKVKGGLGSKEKIRNIDVVYTKEAETADMYIEKVTKTIANKSYVRVVTSDGLEQLIILGHGAYRVSSREFLEEVEAMGSFGGNDAEY